jgi:hypothetical protein
MDKPRCRTVDDTAHLMSHTDDDPFEDDNERAEKTDRRSHSGKP